MQVELKARGPGKGLHSVAYFDFSRFCLDFFVKLHPAPLKRQKLIFNFLWSLLAFDHVELVSLFSDLLKKRLGVEGLLNLLMVKDFLRAHLRQKTKNPLAEVAAYGSMYQHSDDSVELVRRIVSSYDEQFRNFFELKFLKLKGDEEYHSLYDFLALATRAFEELKSEGITPIFKTVSLGSPKRANLQGHTHEGHLNHLLKCYNLTDIHTGNLQDRSKKKDEDVKWFMWSDYPGKSSSRSKPRGLTTKEIGDFFSVEMDEKIQKIKELSSKKKGKQTFSPVPYKNLTEKTKQIIDNLDIEMVKHDRRFDETPDKQTGPSNASSRYASGIRFHPEDFNNKSDLDIFGVFEKLPVQEGNPDKPIMHRMRDFEREEQEKARRAESQRSPEEQQLTQRKRQTIYQLLEEDLTDKFNEVLSSALSRAGQSDRRGTEFGQALSELLRQKVLAIINAVFEEDMDSWFGVIQLAAENTRASDRSNFESLMRRFRELQRARLENLNKGLVQQLSNTIMDVAARNPGADDPADDQTAR